MAYGFGIIGCGMIARFHAAAIDDVDRREARRLLRRVARQRPIGLAAETGCRGLSRLDDMLADPRVHVVTIGTPSGAHMEPAVAAAKAGKHVIVEKPLEITLKRCDAIIAACEKSRRQALDRSFPRDFTTRAAS